MSGLSVFYPLTAATPGLASSVHAGSVAHGFRNPYRCSCDLDIVPPSWRLPVLSDNRFSCSVPYSTPSPDWCQVPGGSGFKTANRPAVKPRAPASGPREASAASPFPRDLTPPGQTRSRSIYPGAWWVRGPSPMYTANTIRGTMTTCRNPRRPVSPPSPSAPASCPSSGASAARSRCRTSPSRAQRPRC